MGIGLGIGVGDVPGQSLTILDNPPIFPLFGKFLEKTLPRVKRDCYDGCLKVHVNPKYTLTDEHCKHLSGNKRAWNKQLLLASRNDNEPCLLPTPIEC